MRTTAPDATGHIVRAGSTIHTGPVQGSGTSFTQTDPSSGQITPEQFTEILPKICSRETAYSPSDWSSANPLSGHCAIACLIAQDLFGGEILRASLEHIPELRHIRSHYWNRLPDGAEVDFTRAQFGYSYPKDLKPEVKDRSYFSHEDTQRRYKLLSLRLRQILSSRPGTEQSLDPTQGAALQRQAGLTARPELIPVNNTSLLEKYGIDPGKVSIVSESKYITTADIDEITQRKAELITKLIEAHEHALKNKKLKASKFSGRQYASNLEIELNYKDLKETFWKVATNYEMNIAELICGERGGITAAVNESLNMLSMGFVNSLPDETNLEDLLKIKRLMMTSSKPLGEDKSAGAPCSDCCRFLVTFRFVRPETQTISLVKDQDKYALVVRTLRDLFPKQETLKVSATAKAVHDLKIEYSSLALGVLKGNPLSEEKIRQMLVYAQEEYKSEGNINEGYSGKNDAASVLFNESEQIFRARRVEWVPRWPDPADLTAAKIGINTLKKRGVKEPNVKAVAYYGDHSDIPSIKSVGRLAQKRGSSDVIMIVIEDDVIQVRTIKDYMPHVHGSVRQLSSNRTTV